MIDKTPDYPRADSVANFLINEAPTKEIETIGKEELVRYLATQYQLIRAESLKLLEVISKLPLSTQDDITDAMAEWSNSR